MAEFRVRHFGGPLVYASSNQNGPFEGLPLDLVGQIGYNGLGGTQQYFNHFLSWSGPLTEAASGGWILSGPTGTATIVPKDTRIGEIVLTNDATGSAVATLQLGTATQGQNYIYSVGKRIWMSCRLKLGTVASTEVFLGFGTADTSPCVTGTHPSDGIFFFKASTDTKISFQVRKDGAAVVAAKALIGTTLVDDTYTILSIYVDPTGNTHVFQDTTELAAGLVLAGAGNTLVAGDIMQFMIGILGASMTMTLDWVLVAQEA